MDLRWASDNCLNMAALRSPGLSPIFSAMFGPSSNVNAMLWLLANDAKSRDIGATHATVARRKESINVISTSRFNMGMCRT
jgi:hypothetical protein